MSKAESMLDLHLKAEKFNFQRETQPIKDRKFRFDFQVWNKLEDPTMTFIPRCVLVEVQGGVWLKGKSGHSSGTGITRDCEKLSLAAVHGYRTIVVTPAQIKSGQAIGWIKAALA